MTIEQGFMVGVGTAICLAGWFFKRIFTLLDNGAVRMTSLEVEMAKLKTHVHDTNHRLDRIEEKLDRLLER